MAILVLTLFMLFHSSAADTIMVDSKVQSATVYLSGAEIHRTASVNLNKGSNHLHFTGLPSSLDEQTLQLRTDASVTLQSISKTENAAEVTAFENQISELMQRKEKISENIERQKALLTVLDRKLTVLRANQNLGSDNEGLTTSQLKQAMAYFEQQFTEIENQRIDYNRELEHLNEQLQEVNKKLEELQKKKSKISFGVQVVLSSESIQEANINLSYYVTDAGWTPSYDLRVQNTDSPATLVYKANISQNTGINWQDISLTITSAEPRSETNLPQFSPSYLSFPQPKAGQMMQARGQDANLRSKANQEMEMPSPRQAQQRQNQTSFSFVIEEPYSQQSGSGSKGLAVVSHSLDASYQYYAFPKKSKSAYLTAKIDNWESLNLLLGEANLFLDGAFVGNTTIDPQIASDTLSFSLGKDDRIIIDREQIENYQEKNFFGNKVTETKGWEITVRNNKDTAAELRLLEQIPISTNEDIKVNLTQQSGASYDEKSGKLQWELNVEAGATQTVRAVFEITYPSGKQIIEGDG